MVSFNIKGKVAIITGGASGLGFQYALELLKKLAKAVVIADVSEELGRKAVEQIESEFGANRAIFIKTDVTDYNQFENVFKTTISKFQNVDILINNAGLFNDSIWQKEIAVNLNGTINGVLLGLENYIRNFKSGDEGLIVNVSSIAATAPYAVMPGYGATKFAIHGLSISWGLPEHYNRTKVRVVAVGPGVTVTPLVTECSNKTFGPEYEQFLNEMDTLPSQSPEVVASQVMTVIEKAPSGTMWIIEGGEPPYQYKIPDRLTSTKIYLK